MTTPQAPLLQQQQQQQGSIPPPPASNKRLREDIPPNIPLGLRNAAMAPTRAQQNMVDPSVLAANEALRREKLQQQQQQQQQQGQPPAKKVKTDGQTQQQPAGAQTTEPDAAAKGDDQQPVPMTKKELVDLLKAKEEGLDMAKKLEAMKKELNEEQANNRAWQESAGKLFGSNADSASLRVQLNKENEKLAVAAQGEVKTALKTAKEVKKLLQTAGKTPSPGLLDGLERLDAYNKNPRQLLQKKCRDDVLKLTGWLGDYNQARMLTVASKTKDAAKLEAKLETTEARYKELSEKDELKKIANGGGGGGGQYRPTTTTNSAPPPPLPSQMHRGQYQPQQYQQRQPQQGQQSLPPPPPPPQSSGGYSHQWQFSSPSDGQQQQGGPKDCWANAQQFRQTHEMMTMASSGGGGQTEGQHYSNFYSDMSPAMMKKVDRGPPLQRPPSSVEGTILPFETFYQTPVSQETMTYAKELKQRLKFGPGQGFFNVPGFTGKDYGEGSDLPRNWHRDDQFTFARGKTYSG